MSRMRIAVIGAGHLGRIHTRLIHSREDVQFVGVVEPVAAAREKAATEFGVRTFADVRELWQQIDAAFVVTPTCSHHEVALPLLERGVHCFIEKPIALSLADADSLIAAARRKNLVLQVGHVERFNPALTAIQHELQAPKYLEAVRASGYTFRSIDVGVVLDLMIHDIDLVLSLVQSEVVDVRAIGTPVFGPHEDMAQARLEFASGAVANLSASRTSYQPQRTLQVFTACGHANLDLGNRTVKMVHISDEVAHRRIDTQHASAETVQAVKDRLFTDYLPLETIVVPEANAIALEQSDFLAAIRERRQPIVTGQQGRDALRVAYRILESIACHQSEVQRPRVRVAA